MNTNTYLGAFLNQFKEILSPLKIAFSDADKFGELLLRLGWDIAGFPVAQINPIINGIDDFLTSFESLTENASDEEVVNVALNGLGLNETAKKNYKKADSLFSASLQIHKKLFMENHPLTAIVYLNYGILSILQNKPEQAEEQINKALSIDEKFFKSDHDIFADIFVAFGDLAKLKGQKEIANEHYSKALAIYKKKFDEKHWKVIATLQKINRSGLSTKQDSR